MVRRMVLCDCGLSAGASGTGVFGVFLAYHPYARAYQTYFQAKAPVTDAESMESLVGAAAVASFLPEGWSPRLVGPRVAYAESMAATIGLVMVAGILILRGGKRTVA